ncbi:hypothetical protein C8J56DRAFT_920209 [Mycena floridula]|nr:hypothetical protein C8J56DRAFT_920209 [Mycena floridula]
MASIASASSSTAMPRSGTISSTRTKSSSIDAKRPRPKDSSFIMKHGHKHHSFDHEKAPYPLAYDRQFLEMESLDNRFISHLRDSVSFVNFEQPPENVLDLGCGTGTWVVDAAKEFPQCDFVGFDLVNIQIPLSALDSPISSRIKWVHGNFLTTKLPFEDDEFDHIHIQSIAVAVPENKWGTLFEELNRVLRPGGSIEIIEDDIVFPSLPRWFTSSMRAKTRRSASVHLPDGTIRGSFSPPQTPSHVRPSHDHALLEHLYQTVFGQRFINMTPSAVLPSYFTTYFRHVILCPVVNFSMPPLPPPPPLTQQAVSIYAVSDSPLDGMDTFDLRSPSGDSTQLLSPPPIALAPSRAPSLSFSSSITARSEASIFSVPEPRTKKTSFSSHDSGIVTGSPRRPTPPLKIETTPQPFKLYTLDSIEDDDTASIPSTLVAPEKLASLSERSSAMHLYRSFLRVLQCEEAMWESLKDIIRNKRTDLEVFGWSDEELEELQNRKRFERLVERYTRDMTTRAALWCSLSELGWNLPPRDPLSKAELIEEERIREAMLEATRYGEDQDPIPCRSLRVLVGYRL